MSACWEQAGCHPGTNKARKLNMQHSMFSLFFSTFLLVCKLMHHYSSSLVENIRSHVTVLNQAIDLFTLSFLNNF